MKDLISVIVPVYNTEKYLDRCIQSILSQTYSNIEILLIDDGSTDSSGAICDKYAEQDSRVRVFHKANGGASTARNMGLDNAKGEWIAFVDSDDWIDAEMYAKMISLAIATSVDAVFCDIMFECEDSIFTKKYESKYEDHKLMYDCLVPIDVVYFSMCNKLIARRVFEKNKIRAVNGANMWEDVELAIRTRYFVKSSNVINLPFYHYNRLNSNSTTRDKTKIKINGQIERVKQIETFFYNIGEQRKYKHFLALLKLQAKKEYFELDLNKWTSIFKEARWSLMRMKNVLSYREVVKYFIASFGGRIGIAFLKLYKKKQITYFDN